MPELLPVNAILFQNLLRDFQIVAAPRVPVWWMSDVIQPVALVNSQVTLDAVISETAMQFATEGTLVTPGAGTILADTGQLAAGTYLFRVQMSFLDAGGANEIVVQHRNAANTGDIWDWEAHALQNTQLNHTVEWVESVVQNERVRAVNRLLAGGNNRWNVIIWRRFLS